MQRIHSQYRNEARAAALFAAEKYRLTALLGKRFDDEVVVTTGETKHNAYNEIAIVCANADTTIDLTGEQGTLMRAAFRAHINELNRAMQTAYNQGAMERARMIEHSLNGVYGAARSLDADGAVVPVGMPVEVSGTGEE
jgi:hypothetical protein